MNIIFPVVWDLIAINKCKTIKNNCIVFFVAQQFTLNFNAYAQNIIHHGIKTSNRSTNRKFVITRHTIHGCYYECRKSGIKQKNSYYKKNKHLNIRESTTKRACHLFSSCFFFIFRCYIHFLFTFHLVKEIVLMLRECVLLICRNRKLQANSI